MLDLLDVLLVILHLEETMKHSYRFNFICLIFFSHVIYLFFGSHVIDAVNSLRITKIAVFSNATSTGYVTASFGATCNGGGMSNKLYEFLSLYGIARTLNRVPFANKAYSCIRQEFKVMQSYFPRLAQAIQLKTVHEKMVKNVDYATNKCCVYEEVETLFSFASYLYINITAKYLQSYKYFDKYKSDVKNLLSFTNEDLSMMKKIAVNTWHSNRDHKVCVHFRRGDFLTSPVQQFSTEAFTVASVFYVREKLLKEKIAATVALLGDDRKWAEALFANYTWAHIPLKTNRVTIDYAFFAHECQTIILTASASTFGFWSAYLSSARNIYYNEKFAKNYELLRELNPLDVFPPNWIPLRLNISNNVINEVSRT